MVGIRSNLRHGGSDAPVAGAPILELGWEGLRYIRKNEQMSSMRWGRPRINSSPRAASPTDAITFCPGSASNTLGDSARATESRVPTITIRITGGDERMAASFISAT